MGAIERIFFGHHEFHYSIMKGKAIMATETVETSKETTELRGIETEIEETLTIETEREETARTLTKQQEKNRRKYLRKKARRLEKEKLLIELGLFIPVKRTRRVVSVIAKRVVVKPSKF